MAGRHLSGSSPGSASDAVDGATGHYQAPRTTTRHPEHRVYPYLLKGLAIKRPNQVWSTDITYIPVQRGFLYLVAIMDWATRRVLSWRLSNTLDAGFCVEALAEALDCYGRPEIFNTDQGSQFTSFEFTAVLKNASVAISMDGRGRCMDNIFIERLWRSMKYEAVYLHELSDGFAAQSAIAKWLNFNTPRGLILPSLAPPQPRPTKKDCRRSCSTSPTACLPLCRLNQNTKS